MGPSNYILEVTEADFEYEVIAHSQQVPVVVDFWAEWCGPCKMLGPILERLAEDAGGGFRLAKVNVDDNPNLALRYNVRGIPAVKAFQNGQVVAEFVGAQPELKVKAFLRELAPSQGDLAIEKGLSMLANNQWATAETIFQEILSDQPDLPPALLGLAKSLLGQGNSPAAKALLSDFPASREYAAAEKLRPLATALAQTSGTDDENEEFLAAAYNRALRLIGLGNLPAALDGLLDILREDKHYRDDEARKVILGVFELLGEESDLTREYRREMASILF
jgi:putative thioredoxin